jgi:hypothetical protein
MRAKLQETQDRLASSATRIAELERQLEQARAGALGVAQLKQANSELAEGVTLLLECLVDHLGARTPIELVEAVRELLA